MTVDNLKFQYEELKRKARNEEIHIAYLSGEDSKEIRDAKIIKALTDDYFSKTGNIKTEFSEEDIETVRQGNLLRAQAHLKEINAEIAEYEDKYPNFGEEKGDNFRITKQNGDISKVKQSDFEIMKETVEKLEEKDYKNFIKAFVSVERGIKDEKILDEIFDGYVNQGTLGSKEVQTPELTEVIGNLTGDAVLKHLKGGNGKKFDVINFAICTNKEDGTKMFTSIAVFDNQIKAAKNLKQGDFVSVAGKLKVKEGEGGKTYRNLKAKEVKLLKTKNRTRESALGKIEKYKNEIKKNTDLLGDKAARKPDEAR